MGYEVTFKRKHPRGRFHRDGMTFYEGTPVVLDELSQVLQEELANPGTYLQARELPPEEAAEKQQDQLEAAAGDLEILAEDLETMKHGELLELAHKAGLSFDKRPNKAALIEALQELITQPNE